VLEAFGGALGLMALVGAFALVMGIQWWQRQGAADAMAEVAPQLGLTVDGEGLRQSMRGSINGIQVTVETVSEALGERQGLYTRFRLVGPNPPPGSIAPSSLREQAIGLATGSAQLITGDDTFDAAVRVVGQRGPMLAHLNANARLAIVAAAAEGWALKDGTWEALEASRVRDPDRIRLLVELGVKAAKASQYDGSLDDALRARAASDPDEGVRASAKAAIAAPDAPTVAPVVPADIGDAEAALQDPARAFEAALTLAEAGDDRKEVRMALVGALPDRERAGRAIPALGKVGGVLEAMSLQGVKGEHEAAALAAIAAIEARQ